MKGNHVSWNQPLMEGLHLILEVFKDDIMIYILNHNFLKEMLPWWKWNAISQHQIYGKYGLYLVRFFVLQEILYLKPYLNVIMVNWKWQISAWYFFYFLHLSKLPNFHKNNKSRFWSNIIFPTMLFWKLLISITLLHYKSLYFCSFSIFSQNSETANYF